MKCTINFAVRQYILPQTDRPKDTQTNIQSHRQKRRHIKMVKTHTDKEIDRETETHSDVESSLAVTSPVH